MAISRKHVTLDEFLGWPETEPALEFIDGRVRQKVSPQGKHSGLQFEVADLFNRFARPRKLARAFPELRATFGGSSPVPDVAVYRWERIPVDAAGEVANRFFEPPDVAIEILSPEQSARSLVERCAWYVEHGVPVALLVNSDDKSVTVFRRKFRSAPLRGAERIDLSDVIPGFHFTPEDLFSALRMR